MSIRLALALLLVSVSTAAADPAAWKTSFTGPAVASQHAVAMDGLVVTGGGAADPARDEAVTAVLDAYRSSGRVSLVIDAAPLGDLTGLADADIVKRAGALAVSHVAVVRLFASTAGQPTAMVSVYDRTGTPVTSFVATAGAALPVRATAAPPAEPTVAPASTGISRDTFDSVASAQKASQRDAAAAKAEFNDNFVWVDGFTVVNGYGMPIASGAIAYQGIERRPLNGASFYTAVGRDDLASRYRSRRNTKIGFIVGGTAVAIGAILYAASGLDCEYPDFPSTPAEDAAYERCEDDGMSRLQWGLGISLVGSLASTIALFVPSHPVPVSTRRQLAIEHNEGLRTRLGLDSEYTPRLLRSPIRDVNVTPYAAAGGGGLVLQGRF
jgi:hypothetical protein